MNAEMDISFKVNNEKFNYRVCAMIISDNKILAMHDERSPYFICQVVELNWEKQRNMLWLVESYKVGALCNHKSYKTIMVESSIFYGRC
mgnify:CR=1 FL=1